MGLGVGLLGSTGWGAPNTLPVVVFPRMICAPTKAGRANSVAVESRSGVPQVGFFSLNSSGSAAPSSPPSGTRPRSQSHRSALVR